MYKILWDFLVQMGHSIPARKQEEKNLSCGFCCTSKPQSGKS